MYINANMFGFLKNTEIRLARVIFEGFQSNFPFHYTDTEHGRTSLKSLFAAVNLPLNSTVIKNLLGLETPKLLFVLSLGDAESIETVRKHDNETNLFQRFSCNTL